MSLKRGNIHTAFYLQEEDGGSVFLLFREIPRFFSLILTDKKKCVYISKNRYSWSLFFNRVLTRCLLQTK